jgi:glutathione reductase (NADPH)
MTQSWDLIVIGGGSGGLACAQRAARHGARVAVVERGPLGGTCVNVGCVPKKIMYHAADVAHALVDAADYGFTIANRGHDWAALKSRRDAYVERLRGIYLENLEKSGAQLVRAHARIAAPGRVVIGDAEHEARHIVVATGGRPLVPDVPGAGNGLTSDGFFALESLPARVAIVGSGYVAAELSGVFAALGSRVTLAIRYDHVLRSFDRMLSTRLMAAMQADGIEIVPYALPTAIESAAEGHRIRLAAGAALGPFDAVIWAVGRIPNTEGLGLRETGVTLGEDGEVATDLRQDTNVEGIHAIGDVTGRLPLTPVAVAAGRRLADRLFGGKPDAKLDYANVPTVVFGRPPLATVGLSEEAARALHGDDVAIYRVRFRPMLNALTGSSERTFMKIVCAGADERVVGVHVVGRSADEMLQGFAVAMKAGATKRDFDETVAIHPTSAEELVLMGELNRTPVV